MDVSADAEQVFVAHSLTEHGHRDARSLRATESKQRNQSQQRMHGKQECQDFSSTVSGVTRAPPLLLFSARPLFPTGHGKNLN